MPSTRELQMLKLKDDCTQIEAQIADLQRVLQQKRGELASLAPVQTLSDDIMYDVFEAAYLHDYPRCRFHDGKIQNSVVVATHVCRRWRRLALELPALWACIHITPEQGERYHRALGAFLKRSQNWQLNVLFNCIDLHSNLDAKRHLSCLKRLLLHKDRWRNCGFYFNYDEQLKSFYRLLKDTDFPSLQFLQILIHTEADTHATYPLQINTPQLRELRENAIFTTNLSLYKGLTHLTLDNFPISSSQLVDILNSTSSTLEKLVLRHLYGKEHHVPSPHKPLQPLLRLCEIAFVECIQGIDILRRLLTYCPNLETLHVVNLELRSVEQVMPPELPSQFPRIRSLIMHGHSYSSESTEQATACWIRLMNMFHGARDVSICHPSVEELLAMSQDMAVTRGWAPLPNWQTLALNIRAESELDAVFSFLRHRVDIGHPLSSVTLLCPEWQRSRFEEYWETKGHDTFLLLFYP